MEGGSAWTTEGPLWTGIASTKVQTYNNIPYMFGGNVVPAAAGWGKIETADIMAWDDRTKEWSKVGVMKEARRDHGVSAIEVNWATLNACKP